MGVMMDVRDGLALYEALDTLAGRVEHDEELASVLMLLTGTVVDRSHGEWYVALDPDVQGHARGVAIRWLRDRGFLPV
jgi:hypothetical protein